MLINYCNEKLHQIFIELTLKSEQEEYLREGKGSLDTIQGYPDGTCLTLMVKFLGYELDRITGKLIQTILQRLTKCYMLYMVSVKYSNG